MSSNPDEPKSRARTDFLLNNEAEVQKFGMRKRFLRLILAMSLQAPGKNSLGTFHTLT
jgi:leucyl-tRNA synthetase